MTALYAPPPRVDRLAIGLVSVLIALTLVGYPMAGLVASGLGLESTLTSFPLRGLVLLVSIVTTVHFARSGQPMRVDMWIIAFFWLYLIRLFWDLQNPAFEDLDQAILFFLGTCVVPALAVMVGVRGYDERLTAKFILIPGAIVCVGAVILNWLGIGDTAELTEASGRLWLSALNPISLGHVGTTTLIAVLVLWRRPGLPGGRAALMVAAVVAAVCLVMAASRGPIVALIVVLISFAVLRGRLGRIVAAGLSLLIVVPMVLALQGITIIDRFTDISGDISARERLIVQGNALEQAMAHPLFGSAYVESFSGQYPHNLIIESFLALGVVGLTVFLFLCLRGGMQAFVRLRSGQILLPLLLVQYFISAMFSGSLWGASALFAVLSMLAVDQRSRQKVAGRPRPALAGP